MYHCRSQSVARVGLGLLTLALMLPALPGTWPVPVQAQPVTSGSWCVSVWYPSSDTPTGYDSLMDNLAVIDEVNPFWYNVSPTGELLPRHDAENVEKLQTWREAGLTILPSIATTGVWAMIETPAQRQAHIKNIVARITALDYDGIDIDYEGFALETREAFSLFIEELAAVLQAEERLLSVTVHAKTADEGAWDAATAQDWPRLAAAVDIFRIMTYDYHNRASAAGPIAPTPWVLDVLDYASQIVDLPKLRLGLPFYGYSWSRGQVAVVTWETVQGWQSAFDLEVIRNPADQETSLSIDVRGLPNQTVYVADATSLTYKLEHVLAAYPQLGGVAIWGLGGEDPANWAVLRDIDTPCIFFEERQPVANQESDTTPTPGA